MGHKLYETRFIFPESREEMYSFKILLKTKKKASDTCCYQLLTKVPLTKAAHDSTTTLFYVGPTCIYNREGLGLQFAV